MHRHALDRSHFPDDLVQRQVALSRQPRAQPDAERGQLTLRMVALRFREQTTALAFQDDHVVYKTRRHQEVPCRLTVPVPLLHKRYNPAAKLHRM